MEIQIRDATLEDCYGIVTWGQDMHAESQFAQYDWDDYKVLGLARALVEDPNGIALVAELVEEQQFVGGMIGAVRPHFFGNHLEAFDYAIYVAPEFRKSRAGFKIIEAYIKKARLLGADEITLGNSTGIATERVAQFYEKAFGFKKMGYNFRMPASGWNVNQEK